jgi:hypothetical protein
MREAPETPHHDAIRLLWMVFLTFGAQIAFLIAGRWLHGGEHASLIFAQFNDFACFRDGARAWLSGGDPYHVWGFVTPPPSLLFSALLAPWNSPLTVQVIRSINVVLLVWALRRYAAAVGLARGQQALFLLASAIFFSTQESVRECNLDVLMLVLLVLTFTLPGKSGGAVALAASIGTKVYSAVFLPVMLRLRQWRSAGIAALTLCLLMLPFHRLWMLAYQALMHRSNRFWNLSIAPASLVLPWLGGDARVESVAALLLNEFIAITFTLALVRDRSRKLTPQTLARYAPWMLSLPSLVFSYVGVQALPVLAALLATAHRRALRRAEWCILAGFLLLGIHLERVVCVLPLDFGTFYFVRQHASMVQSLGVILMIAGTCLTPGGEDVTSPTQPVQR